MAKTVSILVTVDQQAFIQEYENSNPNPEKIRRTQLTQAKLNKRVKMIAVDIDVAGNQASANLEIKAGSGDTIRWYETPLLPSAEYSILINDIVPIQNQSDASQWSQFMKDYNPSNTDYCTTMTQQVMKAYYSGNQLSMFSGRTDYTEATVLTNAPDNGKLYYNIDFQLVKIINGEPRVVAIYYYDPVIFVNWKKGSFD